MSEYTNLHRVIADIIDAHNYIHEVRGQKVVFMLDYYNQLANGERVTDCDFYPYMYGPYSQEVEDAFADLKENGWNTEMGWLYGKVVPKWISYDNVENRDVAVPASDHTDEIETVVRATENWRNKELRTWLKNSWIYQQTPFKRTIRFDRLGPVHDQLVDSLEEDFPEFSIS